MIPPQKFKFEDKIAESSALIIISYLERTFFLYTRINDISSSFECNAVQPPKCRSSNIISRDQLESLSAARKIVSLDYAEQYLYPAFQFVEFRPKSIIAEIILELSPDMNDWEIAQWFDRENGWLDGKAPQESLSEPNDVLFAARQFATPDIG